MTTKHIPAEQSLLQRLGPASLPEDKVLGVIAALGQAWPVFESDILGRAPPLRDRLSMVNLGAGIHPRSPTPTPAPPPTPSPGP